MPSVWNASFLFPVSVLSLLLIAGRIATAANQTKDVSPLSPPAAKTTETRAPLPEYRPAKLRDIIPTAQMQAVTWRYTLEQPADDWMKPDFNDSAWQQGPAGFGTKGTPGAVVRTEWKTKDIWLRREFTLPDAPLKSPVLLMHYDEAPDVYLNGALAAKMEGWKTEYGDVAISPEARATLKPGRNVFAVHCRQTTGGQYIDAGLADTAPTESTASTGSIKSTPKATSASPPPNLRKLMDTPLRDPSICRAPDGTYYLTGTSEPFWKFNNENGIRMWKSKDLQTWEALGTVWRYGSSPWHEKYLKAKKPLWAPEIHYMKGTFWLTYSIPGWDGTGKTSGCGLLKSTTGKPEGPYEDVQSNERMGDEIDASLFEDEDGAIYFLWHSGKIARMKPDMSGLAEPYHWLKASMSDPDPKHHSGLCAGIFGKGSFDHVGYEGVFMFKRAGRYYLCCSELIEGRYSCMIATATNIYGPYGERYEAIPHGGHNTFFKDDKGAWWSTYFGKPWSERAAILPVEFAGDGCLRLLAAAVASTGLTTKTTASAGESATLPAAFKPLFDFPVRDTCVCVGGDGNYYLSGTTGYPTWWKTNEGIRLWKSADLKNWEPLGLVWTFDKDGTWQKKTVKNKRAIWAPEIHYIKNNYWIAYCVNYGGTGLLKSITGKPEGPYADVKTDGPLTGEIDASLFADDDGKVYWVYQNGKIARMKDDMSGLAEEPHLLKPEGAKHVGFEGAFLTKMNGRYVLLCAEFINGMYHCMVAESDSINGPYGKRYLAVPHGGHNTFFKDREGKWWSTFFGNDAQSPFRERPAVLRIERGADGKIHTLKTAE